MGLVRLKAQLLKSMVLIILFYRFRQALELSSFFSPRTAPTLSALSAARRAYFPLHSAPPPPAPMPGTSLSLSLFATSDADHSFPTQLQRLPSRTHTLTPTLPPSRNTSPPPPPALTPPRIPLSATVTPPCTALPPPKSSSTLPPHTPRSSTSPTTSSHTSTTSTSSSSSRTSLSPSRSNFTVKRALRMERANTLRVAATREMSGRLSTTLSG